MDTKFKKALEEYERLPSVDVDPLRFKTISELVFSAQHEIDLDDEGEIELTADDRKAILAFIKKYETV